MAHSESVGNPFASPNEVESLGERVSETTRLFKQTARFVVPVLVVCVLLMMFNIVGVTYIRFVENDPLQNAVNIVRETEQEIELADGRVIDNFLPNEA